MYNVCLCRCTCSRALLSDAPLMLPCEGDGEGGRECCGVYLFFRCSMKASRLRSMSALCRLLRASRLWAAMTVCRCSDVWTRPTLEKRRPFPSVRYSRGYSRSSVDMMWPPPRSGSGGREEEERKCNTALLQYLLKLQYVTHMEHLFSYNILPCCMCNKNAVLIIISIVFLIGYTFNNCSLTLCCKDHMLT